MAFTTTVLMALASEFPIDNIVNVVEVVLSSIVWACAPVALMMAFLMPSNVVAGSDAVVGWAQNA